MTDNLPAQRLFPESIVIQGPTDLGNNDGIETVAKKQLPMLNGMLSACHMALGGVTTLKGLGQVIDYSLKVMKEQRNVLGLNNGPRGSTTKGNPVPFIPD